MKTSVIVNVHAEGSHTFSSKNFNGYKDFSTEKQALKFIKDNNLNDYLGEEFVNKKLGKIIYLKTMEYNKNRSWFESVFDKGFSELANLYWEEERRKENEQRKKEGYIYCKKYEEMTPEDYKGSLNLSLTEEVLKYISSGGVFGYLGHSFRKHAHDKIIEKLFSHARFFLREKELNIWGILGTWLTSSDARHWMDSVEDLSNKEFSLKLAEKADDILTLGFLYNLDEHGGSYASTTKLRAEYFGKINIVWRG